MRLVMMQVARESDPDFVFEPTAWVRPLTGCTALTGSTERDHWSGTIGRSNDGVDRRKDEC